MPERPASLLEATLAATLEKAVNRALAADPASLETLTTYAGRRLMIAPTLPPLALLLTVKQDGIDIIAATSTTQADVTVTAPPADLAALLFNWKKQPDLIGGNLKIKGDRELLQQMSAIFTQINIDWGTFLAPYVGDNLAQQLDYGGQRLAGWLRDTGQTLMGQWSQYLTKESDLLAFRREVYEFCQDVDELRFDVDRLDARIRRLQAGEKPQ